MKSTAAARHWKSTLRLTFCLLVVWALAGVGGGVLFAGVLNQFKIGGFPFGFWMAQQGSIVIFVLLILVYALAMARLDARFRRERRVEAEGEGA